MSAIVFTTPLTTEESSFYSSKFKQLDSENLGIVSGESLKPLFAQSGLGAQVLSQIWTLVDGNSKGFLNSQEFNAALRCIGNLQAYPSLPVTKQLYEVPARRLPVFSTQPAVPQKDIPLPSHNDVAKFSQLFDRTANGQQFLHGDKAKDIFLKANLPNQTLGEIWGLCDRDSSGALDKSEFIMAMYLIQLSMNNDRSLSPVPGQLPAQLWNAVATGILSSNSTGVSSLPGGQLSANSTGQRQPHHPPQPPLGRVSSMTFRNASHDWTISQEKKQQFDALFDSLDQNKQGSLSAQVLVPFFLSSKLNQETLASIWDLADIHNSADFTKLEFAIAMFLIQKKTSGLDLPDVVPNELLNSPALGLNSNNNNQQPPAQQFSIPSRTTKPSFEEAPRQVAQPSNNGSINDLMGLNSSFASPPPALPRHDTNNSIDSNGPPPALKKFTPTSNFGQNIIKEEGEGAYNQPQFQNKAAAVSPQQRSSSVALPQVPNFASLSIPTSATGGAVAATAGAVGAGVATMGKSLAGGFQNNDLYADSTASAQLSNATTDLANLSNQVNSLTTQATATNTKKARATQELQRVNEMKQSIQTKLATLRSTHDANVKQTEQLQSQLVVANKETETLQGELNVVEANFNAMQGQINDLNGQLTQAQTENQTLKERINNFNAQAAALQTQLEEKQQQVKQERSVVDVNSKQIELNDITVANFTNEITGLDEKLASFVSKHSELDNYQKTLEEKHAQLQQKYEELSNTETDLTERQTALDERNQQIEEQEKLYHEQVTRLQGMFDELAQRREDFEKADQDLKNQHMEYATHVQELSERQMKLAMGELPDDAEKIISQNNILTNEEQISKFVDSTVKESHLDKAMNAEGENGKAESDVFSKDVPTVPSQTETTEANNSTTLSNGNENISDRFEGDLNEYGLPRIQSFTSSVANNAPQSVRDDMELPAVAERTTAPESAGNNTITSSTGSSHIPGDWETPPAEAPTASNDTDSETSIQESPKPEGHSHLEDAVDAVNIRAQNTNRNQIDEEFPPIQELDVNDSDSSSSSSSEKDFQDTRDSMKSPKIPANAPAAVVEKDEFDDEFAGLQEAAIENTAGGDDAGAETATPNLSGANAQFRSYPSADLAGELNDNTFTVVPAPAAAPTQPAVPPHAATSNSPNDVSNDEWDEIFAGFGNSKYGVEQPPTPTPQSHPPRSPLPQAPAQGQFEAQPLSKPPVNRAIATTPKSLAIEELSGMGFTEMEATKALQDCNWDLEAATNLLLDSA
ncbi:Ede1p KNAG_0F03650 [Huiozyma naganishii CBS 8797]|uniref:Actin cytoskeleton-regulatory complex protein PAN1 n=1 Tax=Huiozyma naganishii (strain ATCC MYA-139 / BCRC 22969 / CBS 8797 / KCTC 17520 / NBRC 10181 / NCYC 3082 / Yp74L-3) TaxID=1071383 RepID=J7S0K3_HUIN7|nr:hypothetical protein KNAG_0F03650 [Kazachstania naganishii CBS 8797]CCK71027.1 hypothetical protein KNAG_0F03650 [Kazachstania naganishii CBS 8797]